MNTNPEDINELKAFCLRHASAYALADQYVDLHTAAFYAEWYTKRHASEIARGECPKESHGIAWDICFPDRRKPAGK